MSSLTVMRPGLMTTIQDAGRWGRQGSGVPVSGPMDAYSHRLANRIAGNPDGAAALEITVAGPVLRARGSVVCAIAGADFDVRIDDEVADTASWFQLPDAGVLRFGERRAGARAALAVRGGFDVPATFGSRASSVAARIGPFGGRPLRAGDELPIADAGHVAHAHGRPLDLPRGGGRLRVIMGPDEALFGAYAVTQFLGARFRLTSDSNRMGYRLEGPTIEAPRGGDLLSQATPMGSVQVPPSGQPILLMADRQTTGGYPRIATVISADLPLAGQLAPGDWVEMAACTPVEALQALRLLERALTGEAS